MDIKKVIEALEAAKDTLEYNQIIFEMTEGNYLKHLTNSLSMELDPKNLRDAITRSAPINLLRKIFAKLSPLYNGDVTRTTENQADQDLIDFYVKDSDLNTHWGNSNFNFNAYKNTLLEIFITGGRVKARSLPSMQFIPYSDNMEDPLEVTAVLKVMSPKEYWVYSDDLFIKTDEKGNILNHNTEDGLENPYGILPATYINRSSYTLIPTIDTDTVQMALLIGKLLTDVNFSSKYLANPILYGIDVDSENMERSPNIFWNLKSDVEGKTPQLGVVKAEANIQAQIDAAMEELALWLQSKDIKQGTVGKVNGDRASSGISLMIQEMDTTENVNNQKKYFMEAENDFWKRLAQIHNYAVEGGLIKETRKFTDPAALVVEVEYPAQTIIEDPTVKEERILKQFRDRVISKREAISRLNPKMEADKVDELLEEIKAEGAISLPNNFGIAEVSE